MNRRACSGWRRRLESAALAPFVGVEEEEEQRWAPTEVHAALLLGSISAPAPLTAGEFPFSY